MFSSLDRDFFYLPGQIQIFMADEEATFSVTGYSLPSVYIAKQTLSFSLQFVNRDYWTIFVSTLFIYDFVPSVCTL